MKRTSENLFRKSKVISKIVFCLGCFLLLWFIYPVSWGCSSERLEYNQKIFAAGEKLAESGEPNLALKEYRNIFARYHGLDTEEARFYADAANSEIARVLLLKQKKYQKARDICISLIPEFQRNPDFEVVQDGFPIRFCARVTLPQRIALSYSGEGNQTEAIKWMLKSKEVLINEGPKFTEEFPKLKEFMSKMLLWIDENVNELKKMSGN